MYGAESDGAVFEMDPPIPGEGVGGRSKCHRATRGVKVSSSYRGGSEVSASYKGRWVGWLIELQGGGVDCHPREGGVNQKALLRGPEA